MSFYKITREHCAALGSADAAMFYLYITYRMGDRQSVARKESDISEDLYMSVDKIKGIRKHLISLGVLNVVKKGMPPVFHYSTNPERFNELMKTPQPKERKKREVFPDRVGGKYASTLTVKEAQHSPKSTVNIDGNLRSTLTVNDDQTPIYSIDTVVDKYTDSGESDFFEPEIQYFEKPKPQKVPSYLPSSDVTPVTVTEVTNPKIPNEKVFDLTEFERENVLMNLRVETHETDVIAWLFDMPEVGGPDQQFLYNVRGKDAERFAEHIAKYVLYAGKRDFVGTFRNYVRSKKFLDPLVDRRPKPKQSRVNDALARNKELMIREMEELQRLERLKHGH